MRTIDLTGKQIGYWTVVSRAGNTPQGGTQWLCRCKCGNAKIVNGIVLRDERSRSCGCLHRETCIARSTKHGHATQGITPTYHSWASMLARCENPRKRDYPRWGGRGIKVCESWHDFKNFLADMGEKPKRTSLDRINNEGNYEPSNCRWATNKMQANNKRPQWNSCFVELNGERHTIADWAKILNIPEQTLYTRYRLGQTPERVLRY